MGVGRSSEIIQLLEQCEVADPQISGNIAVTGIFQSDAPRYGDILSLDIALEMSHLQIGETRNVPHLTFQADSPTLIRVGEAVLEGGKQDRIVRRSSIVNGQESIDVFCIEAGRWTPQNSHWVRTDTPVSLRKLVLDGADQSRVWAKVDEMLSRWEIRSNTRALGAIYDELGSRFRRRSSRIKFSDDQVGMIVTVDGKVRGMEYFGDLMGFSRDAPGLLMNSYIPEANEDGSGHLSHEHVEKSLQQFYEELKSGKKHCDFVKYDNEILYACAV